MRPGRARAPRAHPPALAGAVDAARGRARRRARAGRRSRADRAGQRAPIRLLGDAVLRRRAWEVADELGWAGDLRRRVRRAHAAAGGRFVTLDAELARSVEGVVLTATIDALRTPDALRAVHRVTTKVRVPRACRSAFADRAPKLRPDVPPVETGRSRYARPSNSTSAGVGTTSCSARAVRIFRPPR